MRRLGAVLVGVVFAVLAGAEPASAAQSQNTWSWWQQPTPPSSAGWNGTGQYVLPDNDPAPAAGQVPQAYQYAHQITVGSGGGYIGIQTDSAGKRAIFSMWGATGATCSTTTVGGTCGPFAEQGAGYQALIPFTWSAGHYYFALVTRSATDCHVWTGWINDTGSRAPRSNIGSLTMPDCGGITWANDASFTEAYGPDAPCAAYPRAVVSFYPPFYYPAPSDTTGPVVAPGFVTNLGSGTCPSSVDTASAAPWHVHTRGV